MTAKTASEWRVTSQYINDVKHYSVYRLRNVNAVDHRGNREFHGGWTTDKAAAEATARKLNEEA